MDASEPRIFTFPLSGWVCKMEFWPDRIKYTWDKFGWGKEKGEKTIIRETLSPHLVVFTGPSRKNYTVARLPGIYAVLALFAYGLLPTPWRYAAFLFLAMAVIAGIRSFVLVRTHNWINLQNKDDRAVIGMQVTKWTDEEREEFKRFYEQWIKQPG